MCSLTLGLMGASMGLSMAGQIQQGKMQSAQYKQQAEVAKQNAAIQAHKSEQIADSYAQKQKALNDRFKLAVGQAKASAGASGLTGDGSVADILSSSADAYVADTQALLENQRNDSWASYVSQVNQINAMNSYNTAAKNSRAQTYWNIAGTLLSGASSMYGQGQKEGLWGKTKSSTTKITPPKISYGPYSDMNYWER